MRTVVALVLASVCFAQQPGRVEGRVVSTSGEPIGKATVRLAGTGTPGKQGVSYVELSTSDGRFQVENIAPGRYTASAARPGFAPARTAAGAFTPVSVEVASGETKGGIEIRLMPLGVVSGIVTDADGDPVVNGQVQLLRYAFNQGRLMLNTSTATNVDDRGQFRLRSVQPGRYYLVASVNGPAPNVNEIRGRSAQEVSLPTYYPNAEDPRTAIPIDVGPTEISNLNLRLRRGGLYSIRGTLVGPDDAPVQGQVTVFPKDGNRQPMGLTTQGSPGTFQVGGLVSGDYTLLVRSNPTRPPAGAPAQLAALSGRLDVSVGSADLNDVTIRLSAGAEITGRISIEGGGDLSTLMTSLPAVIVGPAAMETANLAGAAVVARATPQIRMPSVVLGAAEGPSAQANALVNSDGSFRFQNIPQLKRVLQVTPLPVNTFVKSVRLGGQDVTRAPLDLATGAGGILEILLSTKGAEVTITPRNAQGESPQGGVPVAIWPRTPNRGSATGDVRFFAANVPQPKATSLEPGEYYVAAWDTGNTDYLRVPEFLARFNALATKVTVKEGESVSVEPKIIPNSALEKEVAQFP